MPESIQYDLNQEVREPISGFLYDTSGKYIGKYVYTNDEEHLNAFCQSWLDTYRDDSRFFITLDLETQGLEPDCCKIILVSISWDGENSVVWDARQVVPSLFKEVLDTIPLGNTNIIFDLKFLIHHYGVRPTVKIDTQIGCQMGWAGCWPGGKFFALDKQCEHLLKGLKLNKNIREGFIGMPDDQFATREQIEYSAIDCVVTHNLTYPISVRLVNKGLWDLYQKVEMPLVPVLARTELKGVNIDSKFLEEKYDETSKELIEMKVEIDKMLSRLDGYENFKTKCKGGEFNPGSTDQVVKVLRMLDLPCKNAREDHLAELNGEYQSKELKRIIEYRDAFNYFTKYAKKYPDHINVRTGRAHPQFLQYGAVSGRMSCKNPPMHGVTAKFRPMVVAPEGYLLAQLDYSAYEMRAIAAFSEEEYLLQAFKERAQLLPLVKKLCLSHGESDPDTFAKKYTKGEVDLKGSDEDLVRTFLTTDVHRRVGSTIFGVPIDHVTGEQRGIAKTTSYATLYGGHAATIMESLAKEGVLRTLKECESIREIYFKSLPMVEKFIEKVHREVKENKLVRTYDGRTRWFDFPPVWRSDYKAMYEAALRESVNHWCQAANGSATKMAMALVDDYIWDSGIDAWIPLNVHDELVEISEEKRVHELAEKTEEIMIYTGELALGNVCPVEVSCQISRNWSK